MGSRKFTDEEILKAWEKIKEGRTIYSVARSMGYTYGTRLAERLKKLIPIEEYRKYIKYAKRRSESERKEHIAQEIALFDQGFTLREIAQKLGLTYNQVNDDLKQNYPDKTIWRVLCQNSRVSGKLVKIAKYEPKKYRLTKDDVIRARNMLRHYGVHTVANILGIPYHRLMALPEARKIAATRCTENTITISLLGEWLLGRFLHERFPNVYWHVKENIEGTNLAPDFWTNDMFWDSKARSYERREHKSLAEKQLKLYMQYFKSGYIVYWFGLPKNAEPFLPNLHLVDGKNLIMECQQELREDISMYLKGEFTNLIRKMFGFTK